jgi:hypothetical protein
VNGKTNDFFRIEVQSGTQGYAYSNPIWVVEGDSNANLMSLAVKNVPLPGFDSLITKYSNVAVNDSAVFSIQAVPRDPKALVAIQHPVNLYSPDSADRLAVITVTADNRVNTRIYQIVFQRLKPVAISSLAFTAVSDTTARLTWTKPASYHNNNMTTLVFLKASGSILQGTADAGTGTYSADTNFTAPASWYQHDAAAKCIYKGDSSDVYISGLNPGVTYYAMAYAVNNADSNYSMPALTSGTALPVQYLTFTAVRSQHTVKLNWSTVSEMNNSHFLVERGSDNTIFHEIGIVKGKGDLQRVSLYHFTDASPIQIEVVYYRLKQVDLNGRYAYSEIQAVRGGSPAPAGIAPNPVGNELTVSFDLAAATSGSVEIADISGRVYYTGQLLLDKGGQKFTINTSKLQAGIYFLKMNISGVLSVYKIVKE